MNLEARMIIIQIANDEGQHAFWLSQAFRVIQSEPDKDKASQLLAAGMKEQVSSMIDESIHPMLRELITMGFTRVGWVDVANHFVEECILELEGDDEVDS